MTREKDTPQDDRDWEEESGDTRYAGRPRQPQPHPRAPRASRDDVRIRRQPGPPMRRRPVPPRDEQYRQSDPPPITRRRQTRDFREEEEQGRTYRPRPRPRPQPDPREYEDERYTDVRRRREIEPREDEYEGYARPVRRSGTQAAPLPPRRVQPARRGRGVGSTLLIGFIGGSITIALVLGIGGYILLHTLQVSLPGLGIGTSTFTDKQQTVPLGITTSTTQLLVTNNIGNVSISDSASSSGGTLMYTKKTKANSSSSAASEFTRIQVKVQPGNNAACPATSCLEVNATVPTNSVSADTVDIVIVLPPQSPTPQFTLNGKTQTGNIAVENFNGLLNLTDDTGNVNVKGGLLDAGSCLQTRIGSVTFAGTLETANAPTINPCLGNTLAPGPSQSSQPWYSMKSGTGNVDVTLNSVSTNVLLNATVFDSGKLISDFPITTESVNGAPEYNGPLLTGTQPKAELSLSTDRGNITLHKV